MTEAEKQRLEEIRHGMQTGDIVFLLTQIDVLTFKVANVTTERDVAWQEIERLNADIDKIGTEDDPFWVAACDIKSQLTEAKEEIERLTLANGELDMSYYEMDGHLTAAKEEIEDAQKVIVSLRQERIDIQSQLDETESQLTAANAKVEKLREALIWCGGSNDFAYPDGMARKGWEKTVMPLLADSESGENEEPK